MLRERFVQKVWERQRRALGCERGSGMHGGHMGATWGHRRHGPELG